MNLAFRILWFDDQDVSAYEQTVEEILNTEYYLELEVKKLKGNEDLSDYNFDLFDLIMMDYELLRQETGINKFKEIRKKHSYVDVGFYSTKIKKLKEELQSSEIDLEGMYYIPLNSLTIFKQKIKEIIYKIVKRSESIENLRGIFLNETANFDRHMFNLIENLMKKYKLEEVIEKYLRESIFKDRIDSNDKQTSIMNSCSSAVTLCLDRKSGQPFLDAYMTSRVLNHIIKLLKKQKIIAEDDYKDFYELYINNIIEYRNAFAHVSCDNKCIIIKNKVIEINNKLHAEMRSVLKNYNTIFVKLSKL